MPERNLEVKEMNEVEKKVKIACGVRESVMDLPILPAT